MPDNFVPDMTRRYLDGPRPDPMPPPDRRTLIDFYREDIALLATLVDRDLSGWLK